MSRPHSTRTRRPDAATSFRMIVQDSWWTIVLLGAVFFSALLLVYIKTLNRRLFTESQVLQAHRDDLQVQWGKLLLEQSTWATQSRIQEVSKKEFHMRLPQGNETVLLTAKEAPHGHV